MQSAIQDFKRRLTLRIGALEEEGEPAPPAPEPEAAPEYPQPLTATQLPEQEPQAAYPVASTTPDEPQSEISFTQQYAESAPTAAEIPEDPAAIAAAEALAESEQAALRQQEAVRNAIQQGQDLLSQDQPILAMRILQQAAAQYPGQSEIEELLALAESRAQEQKIVEIERQADAETRQGQFEQALSTLEEGLAQFPEAEPLRKARESVSTARDRAERLAEARRLRGSGELQQALELVEAGLQGYPQDRELKALKLQIESDQAKRQRQEAIANATEKAQRHLRDGQTILALEVLRRCDTRFPDDETVSRLLRTAEEQHVLAGFLLGRIPGQLARQNSGMRADDDHQLFEVLGMRDEMCIRDRTWASPSRRLANRRANIGTSAIPRQPPQSCGTSLRTRSRRPVRRPPAPCR